MYRACIILLLVSLILTGCNLPSQPTALPTATPDIIATEVSRLMTAAPTLTAPLPSATSAPALATLDLVTETAAPTDTATAEAPTPTLTLAVSPTPSGEPPDWTETFDTRKLFYEFDNGNTRVAQSGGSLVLTGLSSNGWLGYSLTYNQKPQNFRMEAVFTTQSCSGSDIYGLIFRAPNDTAGYFFGITCDGRYNLRGRNFADGSEANAVELTENPAIRKGANQTNRISVTAEGSTMRLYANGTLLHEVSDESFTEAGYIGAFIAANETPGFTVNLEEISIWNLP